MPQKKPIITLLFACFWALSGMAQKNQTEELAAQYLANGEYAKATVLYEELLDKEPKSPYYYDNLLTCYFKLTDYNKAEKMVKGQKKKFPLNYSFKVDLGYVYSLQGEEKKAQEEYETCVKELKIKDNQEAVIQLSNAFIRRDLYQWGIQTILKARSLYKENNILALELAALYSQVGNTQKMVEEYLNHLVSFDFEIEKVQNSLSERLKGEDWKLLKKELLTRIQKTEGNEVYTEMLMWLLVQQKDFYGAFIQFKSFDKRKNENGARLIELANLAISNDALDVAIDCYKYVVSLGNENRYYTEARLGLLTVSFKRITEYGMLDSAFIEETENNYRRYTEEIGENYVSAAAMRQLANLYNYYSNQPLRAIELLEKIVVLPRVPKSFIAECKLELGDSYLVSGDIWEAQLLYGQVDKDFKDEPLGQEAKYRNARLSFYKGEFEWAQAQLDVLKSATSHLISNNAIELSMLIQDNYGFEDGDDTALKLYADADLFLLRNQPDLALQKLDSIKKKYPTHSLNDELLFAEARIYKKKKDFSKAAFFYEQIYTNYQYDILADNAVFELAELYERMLDNKEKAKILYEKIITDYPGSLYSVEARKRYRRLRGDAIQDIPQEILEYRQ